MSKENDDDLRKEYDFSKMKLRGQGLYSKKYNEGTNLVHLEPDVALSFPDDRSVNEALRLLIKIAEKQVHAK